MREKYRNSIPYGPLGVIALTGCTELGDRVNDYLVKWRHDTENTEDLGVYEGYVKDSYLVQTTIPRFGSGEGKGVIEQSVRGMDLYLMVDVCNYSTSYSINGKLNPMSPDDHYQNLKRVIAAVAGKARRITVISMRVASIAVAAESLWTVPWHSRSWRAWA
jgi:ribose-phosphate pyrophosphokinase